MKYIELRQKRVITKGLDLMSPVDYLLNNNWFSKMCWTNTVCLYFMLYMLY